MTDRELLAQCHDQLRIMFNPDVPLMQKLTARLAQPEPTNAPQEPVAWAKAEDLVSDGYSHAFTAWNPAPGTVDTVPLYTAPPQREWQGLTDEEIDALDMMADEPHFDEIKDFARAIEAKLKEKNA